MVTDGLDHAHLVGDDHHGDAQLLIDVPDQLQNLMGGVGVQSAGGLVAQQHLGLGSQRTGNSHTLLLAAGQLRRVGLCLIRQAHQLQQFLGPADGIRLLHPGQLHGEAHVLQAGALHQQIKPLEDHGDLPPGRPQLGRSHGVQPLAVHHHLARRGSFQQIDTPHQRALTGTAHADDAVDVPVLNGQGDVLQRIYPSRIGVKGLTDVL